MSINLLALVGAMLTIATPLVWAGIGELIVERGGVLNLGIEGTMYLGAFVGFLAALRSGSVWVGRAIVSGVVAGALMGLFAVTLGLNQHVSGLGLSSAADRPPASSRSGSSTQVSGLRSTTSSACCSAARRCSASTCSPTSASWCWHRSPGGCSARPGWACGCTPSARTSRPRTWPASRWPARSTSR